MHKKWLLSVDTGGTFTDCVALSPDGEKEYLKVLSSGKIGGSLVSVNNGNQLSVSLPILLSKNLFENYYLIIPSLGWQSIVLENDNKGNFILEAKVPKAPDLKETIIYLTANEEAPILAARLATHTRFGTDLPEIILRLGTTKGTNALLENKGSATALIVTKGFSDLLTIGTQQRPDLFALNIIKPKQLPKVVIEVKESISSTGLVVDGIEEQDLEQCLQNLRKSGCDSVAISFKNSYLNPVNEELLATFLSQNGINNITCSAQLYPSIKYLTRTETAVVNAYLSPVLKSYLDSISHKINKNSTRVMTSAGALANIENFNAKDSLLSGPAGGIIGAAHAARKANNEKVLTVDMGGTSTDVARYNSGFDYTSELTVGNAHIFTQALTIETVAAGGGSICSSDEGRLSVGPGSAGAMPGPACYGNKGPLTVTDLNLLSGRLDEAAFGVPLDKKAAKNLLEGIGSTLAISDKTSDSDTLLLGFLALANQTMADAVKKISISKGFDPKEYALLGFGGAVGQHICDIADLLHIKRIIAPYNGSLLSAVGISKAVIEKHEVRQILLPLRSKESLLTSIDALSSEALDKIANEGVTNAKVSSVRVFMRLTGQDTTLEVSYSDYDSLAERFKEKYITLFGHWVEREIEVESIKVTVAEPSIAGIEAKFSQQINKRVVSKGNRSILFEQGWLATSIYEWPEYVEEQTDIIGPAILYNPFTSIIINPGWKGTVDNEQIILSAVDSKSIGISKKAIEAVELSLFTNRFKSVAEQMGSLLQRTALSVNIKERLDFSCALLDMDGRLVVNAPHIPVHLGSLGICTRSIIDVLPLKKGDIAITNHPAFGGSHLPDVTLIAPIYDKEILVGYIANRAHHAEIGGKAPGSMPADAQNLTEEGVVISPMLLVSNGKARWEILEELMLTSSFPTRNIDDNLADFQAAVASILEGQKVMAELLNSFGSQTIIHYMKELSSLASNKLSLRLNELNFSKLRATEYLDDGSKIAVSISRNKKLKIDFNGTSITNNNNLNATEAIVNGAVIYVLKLLIGGDLPLNEGLMKDVELFIPKGTLLNPRFSDILEECPAVVGGNTEVSQRLVDTLLKAFKLASCSQGTMNNFLFGDNSFGYYETICGGTGAGPGFNGTDAVHQHMTNTQITDPEILEFRYPVILKRFCIRKNSGGEGKYHGGNGVIREFEFKKPVTITFLTQHRKEGPYGLEGGGTGMTGEQYCLKKTGENLVLDGVSTYCVEEGDSVVIMTPGGGGYEQSDK